VTPPHGRVFNVEASKIPYGDPLFLLPKPPPVPGVRMALLALDLSSSSSLLVDSLAFHGSTFSRTMKTRV